VVPYVHNCSVSPPYVDPLDTYIWEIYSVTKDGSVCLCQCKFGGPWTDVNVILSGIAALNINLYILNRRCYPTMKTIFSIKFLIKSVCRLGDSYHVERTVELTVVFMHLTY
jgi:hypothetical protein